MKVRKMNETDLNDIAKIEAICFPSAEAASLHTLEKRYNKFPECFWVLEEHDTVIGFINGMCTNQKTIHDEMFEDADKHEETGLYQSVFGISVLPSYQKQGGGKLLMEMLIDCAKKQQRKGCILTCKEHLIGYYERFGYELLGVSQSVHGGAKWYDMILLF